LFANRIFGTDFLKIVFKGNDLATWAFFCPEYYLWVEKIYNGFFEKKKL